MQTYYTWESALYVILCSKSCKVVLLEKEDLPIKGITPNLTTEEIQVKPDQTVGLTLENVKQVVKILMG